MREITNSTSSVWCLCLKSQVELFGHEMPDLGLTWARFDLDEINLTLFDIYCLYILAQDFSDQFSVHSGSPDSKRT